MVNSTVVMYTDGGCSPNPGPGGWAALLSYGEHEKMVMGSYARTTNNRMELMAVIEGLRCLKQEGLKVDIYVDSKYVHDAFELGWVRGWKLRGWYRAKRKPVKNPDLWRQLDALVSAHKVRFYHVPAHAGVERNERVDRAVGKARRQRVNWQHDEVYEREHPRVTGQDREN